MTYIYDGVVVTEKKNRYVVRLEDEDSIISIKKEEAENLAASCDEEPYMGAVVLAYIEYARILTRTNVKRAMRKIPEEQVFSTIPILWNKYQDNLIGIIKSLSYIDIKDIMTTANPLELLEEKI